MPTYGLVFPVQPGKESLVREVSQQLRDRRAEYLESRQRGGMTVERAYLQKNPDGSTLVLAYLELPGTFTEAMKTLVTSDLPIDRYFIDKNIEATGVDFRTMPPGPEPEMVAQWMAPGYATRARGVCVAAPLRPGKTDAGRQFAREAFVNRRSELTQSRLALNETREEVFINQTPTGDVIVVYIEGDDPIAVNRGFAASNAPFDRWFKDQCKEIFPDYVDWDQPIPPIEELFSWVKGQD